MSYATKTIVSMVVVGLFFATYRINAFAQSPGSGGSLTGMGEGVKLKPYPCGPIGTSSINSNDGSETGETCPATGSRATSDILQDWLLTRSSLPPASIYPGIHGVRVHQKVKYGNETYWQSAGWYTDSLTEAMGATKKQKFRPFCFISGPDGVNDFWTGSPVTVNVTSESGKLAAILRLNQDSACDRDLTRCSDGVPGRTNWIWECRFESDEWVDSWNAADRSVEVKSQFSPEIEEIRQGFVTHDFGPGNNALTRTYNNSYFVAPVSRTGPNDYSKNSAEVFWGKDSTNEHDGIHVKFDQISSWEWTTCMGDVASCIALAETCRDCPAPAKYGEFNGILRSKIPLSISASELSGYPQLWRDALDAAVDDINGKAGITLLQDPSYGGGAGDVTIDVVLESERDDAPYYWGGMFDMGVRGQFNGDWTEAEIEPGCKARYLEGGDLWVAEKMHYYWGPFHREKSWTQDALQKLFIHEFGHGLIGEGHPGKKGSSTQWMCEDPNKSVMCTSTNLPGPPYLLTDEDEIAIECIYDDIINP